MQSVVEIGMRPLEQTSRKNRVIAQRGLRSMTVVNVDRTSLRARGVRSCIVNAGRAVQDCRTRESVQVDSVRAATCIRQCLLRLGRLGYDAEAVRCFVYIRQIVDHAEAKHRERMIRQIRCQFGSGGSDATGSRIMMDNASKHASSPSNAPLAPNADDRDAIVPGPQAAADEVTCNSRHSGQGQTPTNRRSWPHYWHGFFESM